LREFNVTLANGPKRDGTQLFGHSWEQHGLRVHLFVAVGK
jgi:hypothetical protein